MQRVKSATSLCHSLLDEIDILYADLSVKREPRKLVPLVCDTSVRNLMGLFEGYADIHRSYVYVKKDTKPLDIPEFSPKNIIVCFSGGKDSFAVARHYQGLGYNVYLYHLKGLNATYCGKYSEHLAAQKCAEYMGLPLTVEEISYSGYHEWTEHPLKNMVLAARALSWGIREGITTKVAVGSFKTAMLDDNAFEVCAGDCIEMWKAYDRIVRRIIPKFHTYIPNDNYQTAYEVLEKEPQALEVLISCMTPNRFRDAFRKRTERNYNIRLLPNRCGCCWKDCAEYVYFTDKGVLQLNERYYVHCLEVLAHTHEKETGARYSSIYELWNDYFFYPMSESKMYEVIRNAKTIRANGKIVCTVNNP